MSERPILEADLPAVAGLFNALEEAIVGRPGKLDANAFADWLKRGDSLLIEDEGVPVAGVMVDVQGPVGVFGGAVHPRAFGRGHGSRLAEFSERLIGERDAERIHTFIVAGDVAAGGLFSSRGYHEVRRFWDMAIELTVPPPEPVVPDGLVLDDFEPGEERAFFDALGEAFQDHWEWHSTPYDEWLAIRSGQHRDEHGPLWLVVRDGDEIAAVIRNEANSHGGGYVGAIGVRRPWRGRGLAKALLHRTFGEFWRRGTTRVSLGVDAESPTGATRLYDSVGMHVELESVVYEKPAK